MSESIQTLISKLILPLILTSISTLIIKSASHTDSQNIQDSQI